MPDSLESGSTRCLAYVPGFNVLPMTTFLRRPEPATLVWIALTAVLLLLVAFPLGKLLLVSLHTRAGVFTFGNYLAAYGRARYVESLWN